MMRAAAFAFVLLHTINLQAQVPPVSFIPFEALAGDLKDVAAANDPVDVKKANIAAALAENTQELAQYALGAAVYSSLIEENRLDKQIGASAAGAGSTSLVSLGSVPALIGVAVESGALYQSVSGSVVTFRMNPAGLARALAKTSYLLSRPPGNAAILERGLSRLSVSASFDFEQGSSPGTFTGKRSH